MSTTIRVSDRTKARIASISAETGRPMVEVLDDAVDELERKVFFDRLNRRFLELRAEKATWDEVEGERRMEAFSLPDTSR